MSEWISVEDRLPEEDQDEKIGISKEVFVHGYNSYNGKNITTVGWCHVNMKNDRWGSDLGAGCSTFHFIVTHWMPLPEPPEI